MPTEDTFQLELCSMGIAIECESEAQAREIYDEGVRRCRGALLDVFKDRYGTWFVSQYIRCLAPPLVMKREGERFHSIKAEDINNWSYDECLR